MTQEQLDKSLVKFSETGHLDIVKVLIEAGAKVNTGNGRPLCWASGNGHLDIVKALVEAGADVNIGNGKLLCWAVYRASLGCGHSDIVEYLKSKGAK